MEERRRLTDEETKFVQKAIGKLEKSKRILWSKLRELDHMIHFGLQANFEEKLDELKMRQRDLNAEYQENELNLIVTHDQLQRGVLVKPKEQKEK